MLLNLTRLHPKNGENEQQFKTTHTFHQVDETFNTFPLFIELNCVFQEYNNINNFQKLVQCIKQCFTILACDLVLYTDLTCFCINTPV